MTFGITADPSPYSRSCRLRTGPLNRSNRTRSLADDLAPTAMCGDVAVDCVVFRRRSDCVFRFWAVGLTEPLLSAAKSVPDDQWQIDENERNVSSRAITAVTFRTT